MLLIALLYLILLLSRKLGDVTVLKARDATLYVGLLDPKGEGSTMLRNVKNCQTNGTAPYPKRLKSSAILVRAHELSCFQKNAHMKSHTDVL
jgi:hypothetical protein